MLGQPVQIVLKKGLWNAGGSGKLIQCLAAGVTKQAKILAQQAVAYLLGVGVGGASPEQPMVSRPGL